ncbi:MAG: 4Fe-4S binding protein [Sedimentibacter sp.]|uniref:4Fe-4S binding protein n=1 Tax=Sedimentibacter sp. TaxID=1960295 RepID=UPI003158665E
MKNKNIRRAVQIFFFALIALITVNKTLAESGSGSIPFLSDASLHALCPFGGVVTLYNLFTLGTFIKKIHMSSVILMSVIFILAILFGPVFCGWVCPLGSAQEWVGKAGRKIFKNRYNSVVPKKADRILRYLRYGVLIWVVYITSISGYLIFDKVDPYNALFSFWSEEAAPFAIAVLVVTLVLSLFTERPWCKYACPYGALLGITNKFRIFKIRRNDSSCISCRKCDRSCPMNIEVSSSDTIRDLQCISCFECTSERSCPVDNTVNLQTNVFAEKEADNEN